MSKETLHRDFETIEREDQDYRISTKVTYDVDRGTYKCIAQLFKSRNGKVVSPRRDKMFQRSEFESEKDDVEETLDKCIASCKMKMNDIEDAKDISVGVSIDG